MENKYRDAVIGALTIVFLTLLMLALSSGGMYFIENLSIQFFGEEPSPAVNLWVIGWSTIALPAFILYVVWAISKEEAKAKEANSKEKEKQVDQLALESVPVGFGALSVLEGRITLLFSAKPGKFRWMKWKMAKGFSTNVSVMKEEKSTFSTAYW